MTRLLIFSPYALWRFHTTYEETIAKAAHLRGASVEYLLCDGISPECDQYWQSKATSPRPSDICQRCQSVARVGLDTLGFPYRWLGQFLSASERAEALAWAQVIPTGGLLQASFRGDPLGDWILSSVVSYFRKFPPDFSDSRVVDVYRGFLLGAALTAIGINNFLQANAVDAALLFNGRQSLTRVAFEIFRQRGIRVLTHERAEYIRGHLNVRSNAHCMNLLPFKDLWAAWSEIPLTTKSLQVTLAWLIERRYGANLAWIPFNASSARDSSIKRSLRLSPGKLLWVLFTSSTDETAGDPLWRGPYATQTEWVRDVIAWVSARPDVELVIKVHPNLGGNSYIGKAVDELGVYQQLRQSLQANVRMVMPEDSVDAYSLADAADLGLTWGSTIGLEMAMLGKPVLLASRALYEHASCFLILRSKASLPALLEQGLKTSQGREIQRQAFRLAYYYIFTFEPAFPKVTMVDLYKAEPNYSADNQLAAGQDKSLDRICRFLVNGDSLVDRPAPDEQSRSTQDEDAFFSALCASPHPMRNLRYERWLRLKSAAYPVKKWVRLLPFGIGDALLDAGRGHWHALLRRLETAKRIEMVG